MTIHSSKLIKPFRLKVTMEQTYILIHIHAREKYYPPFGSIGQIPTLVNYCLFETNDTPQLRMGSRDTLFFCRSTRPTLVKSARIFFGINSLIQIPYHLENSRENFLKIMFTKETRKSNFINIFETAMRLIMIRNRVHHQDE